MSEPSDPAREYLLDLQSKSELNMAEVSRAIGKDHAYIQQFIGQKQSPRFLPELQRILLTAHFGLPQGSLVPDYLGTGKRAIPKGQGARPAPAPHDLTNTIALPVELPSEQRLTDMFAGMLTAVKRPDLVDELAQKLARAFPTALKQTQVRQRSSLTDAKKSLGESALPRAKRGAATRPRQRT